MPNRVQQKRFERLGLHQPVKVVEEKVVVETVVEPVAPKNSEEELKSLNKSELIALAEQLNLDTTGTKAELISRILGQ